ncbi:MAG: E3 binding domain-containing protein, partial [Proteiniphilum sp.]|nr:E3 binding domain-containing protein [Proteiniphilum sp.]
MAVVVIMPKQGQSVESCIITEIKKKKGDRVKKGEVLFSYETDKASFEEESPAEGVVLASFYNEGDEVPVLENMMVIGDPGEDISSMFSESLKAERSEKSGEQKSEEKADEKESQSVPLQQSLAADESPAVNSELLISPRAGKLAEKEALDVSQIIGSGPHGRVIEKDVLNLLQTRPRMTPLARKIASEQGTQPQASGTGLAGTARAADLSAPVNAIYGKDYEEKKISNIRKLIAKSMHASLQNSAQLTHHLGADA